MDIDKAINIVNDINHYEHLKVQLIEASVTCEVVGICYRDRKRFDPLKTLPLTDAETKAALNEFVDSTLRYYDNIVANLTNELSKL